MQVIAGIVEHRISDEFSSQILFVNMLSFLVRTVNSYWGTQVRALLKFYMVSLCFMSLFFHPSYLWMDHTMLQQSFL